MKLNFSEINFDSLPDQFVLKCNHDSGGGMSICRDKSKFDKKTDAIIHTLCASMMVDENLKAEITGHTDNTGKADYNMRLSKARVESVKNELMKRGIDGSRVNTVGKGMTEPIADNKTKEGRAQNRRVEIIIEEE